MYFRNIKVCNQITLVTKNKFFSHKRSYMPLYLASVDGYEVCMEEKKKLDFAETTRNNIDSKISCFETN